MFSRLIGSSVAEAGILATAALIAVAAVLSLAHAEAPIVKTGIAMYGEPKYAPGFLHFDYVNPKAAKGGTLRLAALGSFDSLNPFIIKGSPVSGMRDYVYETLLARSYDEPFSLYGLIAESVETPEDRSSVTFQLRPEAHFSDGKPIEAKDVLFSWSLLKAKGRPNHRTYYAKVARAEQIGERGVKFTFAEGGDREMPLIMGLMPILPRHTIAEESFDKTSLEGPVGSGPYVVAKVAAGASIVFQKDPNYWARALAVTQGQFNFDSVQIDYYRDKTAMMEAFRKGLFDVLGDSESIDAVIWADAFDFPAVHKGLVKKLEFDIGAPVPMAALVFNTRRAPLGDRQVRQALTLLLDFEWINRALYRGLYARTQSFFDRSELSSFGRAANGRERELLLPFAQELAPGILEGQFIQPATDGSGTNREGRKRALLLLKEAGYELKGGSLVSPATGQPLQFEMICQTREQERLMLAYADALNQLGIGASIRLIDAAQFQRRSTSFDFDMMPATWPSSLSPGNEQNYRWSREVANEEGSFNYAGVQSAGVDAMIEALLSARSREDFVSAVKALDRILLSGRYVIPLFYAPKQWIAAWSHLQQPPISTLYGTRLETWWTDSPNSGPSPKPAP